MTTRTTRAFRPVRRPAGYAPVGLQTDPSVLGLEEVTVSSPLGTAVARHRRTSPSTRATIFLHGAAGSWTTWTPLLITAGQGSVILPNPVLLDLPGWGDATLTAAGEDVAIEAVCALVKDAAEELGYTEWDLVGHSMGGFIALHMASLWPECVMSVGVISPTGWSIIDSVAHPLRRFFLLPGFTLLWQAMRAMAAFGHGGNSLLRAVRRVGLLPLMVSPLFRHVRRIDPSVVDALADEARPRAFSIAAEITRGYDAAGHWGRIECPVRALAGDADVFSTPSDLSRLQLVLSDGYTTTIADCGHFAAIERPAETLVALGFAAE